MHSLSCSYISTSLPPKKRLPTEFLTDMKKLVTQLCVAVVSVSHWTLGFQRLAHWLLGCRSTIEPLQGIDSQHCLFSAWFNDFCGLCARRLYYPSIHSPIYLLISHSITLYISNFHPIPSLLISPRPISCFISFLWLFLVLLQDRGLVFGIIHTVLRVLHLDPHPAITVQKDTLSSLRLDFLRVSVVMSLGFLTHCTRLYSPTSIFSLSACHVSVSQVPFISSSSQPVAFPQTLAICDSLEL